MPKRAPSAAERKQPGRVKQRYNPTPTARERAYHLWLLEEYPCVCRCGRFSECVHHPLTRHPEQRWRRDHEYVVPMTDACHRALHARGKDGLTFSLAVMAGWYRRQAIEAYKL